MFIHFSTNLEWKINYENNSICLECHNNHFLKIYKRTITDSDPIFNNNTMCNSIDSLKKLLKNIFEYNVNDTHFHIGFNSEKIIIKLSGLIDSLTIEVPATENLICNHLIHCIVYKNDMVPQQLTPIQIAKLITSLDLCNTKQLNRIWSLLPLISDMSRDDGPHEFTGESKASLRKYRDLIMKRNISVETLNQVIDFSKEQKYICRCKDCNHRFLSNDDTTIGMIKEFNNKFYNTEYLFNFLNWGLCPICNTPQRMIFEQNDYIEGFVLK